MNLGETKKLGRNTRFVFSAPRWWVSALLILLISLLSGFLFGNYTIALLYFAVPAYLSALFAIPLARLLNVRYWLKTELFLGLFQSFMSAALLFLFFFLGNFLGGEVFTGGDVFTSLFFISFALPLWLRWAYLASIISTSRRNAMALTLTYPLSQMLGYILAFSGASLIPITLYSLYASTSILFSFIFTETMDRPLKRVLGVGGLEFTRWTLEHYKERTELGKRMLERIFRGFGTDASIQIRFLSFRRNGRVHGIMAVHTAHMGPFGEVGGSNMPEKLSKLLDCRNLISPHGASTHEMNPVDESEVIKIAKTIEEMRGEEVMVSAPVRMEGGVKVLAQRFGEHLLIVESSHPDGTEDVDPAVAMLLEEKVAEYGYKGLIFIDAHNCSTESAHETFVHSRKYRDIEEAVMQAAKFLKESELGPAKIGIGRHEKLVIEHGIGPMGIISLVVEAGGKRSAYVVMDANNMVKGLRDEVLSALKNLVDEAEVMTTDNHYVNRIDGGSNPVGSAGYRKEIIEAAVKSVKSALSDMHDCDVGMASGDVTVRVFGSGTPAKLVAVPMSVGAMGKSLAFLDILSLVLIDLFLAILI